MCERKYRSFYPLAINYIPAIFSFLWNHFVDVILRPLWICQVYPRHSVTSKANILHAFNRHLEYNMNAFTNTWQVLCLKCQLDHGKTSPWENWRIHKKHLHISLCKSLFATTYLVVGETKAGDKNWVEHVSQTKQKYFHGDTERERERERKRERERELI